MNQPAPAAPSAAFADCADLDLHTDAFGRLMLSTRRGETAEEVTPVRAFPLGAAEGKRPAE